MKVTYVNTVEQMERYFDFYLRQTAYGKTQLKRVRGLLLWVVVGALLIATPIEYRVGGMGAVLIGVLIVGGTGWLLLRKLPGMLRRRLLKQTLQLHPHSIGHAKTVELKDEALAFASVALNGEVPWEQIKEVELETGLVIILSPVAFFVIPGEAFESTIQQRAFLEKVKQYKQVAQNAPIDRQK